MLMASIFIAMLIMICINIPIAVALAMCGVLGLLLTEGADSLVTIALDMYDGSTKFSLIAIPMFVLAGAMRLARFNLTSEEMPHGWFAAWTDYQL